jgi:hypothetical protein
MEREMGEFQKFQETNPDPSTWKAEWDRRASEWPGRYLEGRDYPQALQDSIRARVLARGQQFGIDVDVAATKATVAMARESLMAEVELAEADGRMDEASALLKTGVDRGWVRADVAAQREVQAREKIENQTISEALQYADAFATRGDMPSSFAALDSIRGMMPEGEYQAKRAKLETQVSVAVASNEIMDRMANGEDPDALRAELEARNEDGSFVAYPELRPAVRADILAPIYQASNDEYSALVSDAGKGIDSGIIRDENDLNEYFQGKEIDTLNKAILVKKLRGEAINTEKAVVDLEAAAAGYDPSNDPDGRGFEAQKSATRLTLGDDPRVEGIIGTLTKRRNGEPLTLAEDIFRQKAKETADLRDSAADYQLPASQLEIEERDGRPVFVDYSQEPEAGDPDRFEKETGSMWWKGTKAGRVVHVSQEDRTKLETAISQNKTKGVYVTDLKKKGAADSETAGVLNEMKRRADTGDLTPDNWQDEYKKTTAPIRAKVADKELEDAFAPGELELPSGGSGRGDAGLFPNPSADLEWLNSLELE